MHGSCQPLRQRDTRAPREEESGLPQGEQLTRLCEAHVHEFFSDQFGRPHVVVRQDAHLEVWPASASRFSEAWLAKLYRDVYGRTPGGDGLRQARIQAEALCYEGARRVLHNRVAWQDGALWYDLSNDGWQAVKITPAGWSIEAAPQCFRRYKHQEPQAGVVTGRGAETDPRRLLDFCNIPKDSQLLFMVLVATWFIPDIPHPILVLHGEQGTAKSTTCRMLKRLIDPAVSGLNVLAVPKDEDRAVRMFDHHWFCPLDNVSKVSNWLSDMLCRAVTGEGVSKRRLYTDDEDFIRAYRRCIVLNGINNPVLRGDLLDHAILIETFPLVRKVPEEELEEHWREALPGMLSGFFGVICQAMKGVKAVPRESVSEFRMADFTRWGMALADALGYQPDAFLTSYREAINAKFAEAVEGDPLAGAIRHLVTEHTEGWSGTAADLLEVLNPLRDEGQRSRADLPRSVVGLGRRLTCIAPALRRVGLSVRRCRQGRTRTVDIKAEEMTDE